MFSLLQSYCKQLMLELHPDLIRDDKLRETNTSSLAHLNALLDFSKKLLPQLDSKQGRIALPSGTSVPSVDALEFYVRSTKMGKRPTSTSEPSVMEYKLITVSVGLAQDAAQQTDLTSRFHCAGVAAKVVSTLSKLLQLTGTNVDNEHAQLFQTYAKPAPYIGDIAGEGKTASANFGFDDDLFPDISGSAAPQEPETEEQRKRRERREFVKNRRRSRTGTTNLAYRKLRESASSYSNFIDREDPQLTMNLVPTLMSEKRILFSESLTSWHRYYFIYHFQHVAVRHFPQVHGQWWHYLHFVVVDGQERTPTCDASTKTVFIPWDFSSGRLRRFMQEAVPQLLGRDVTDRNSDDDRPHHDDEQEQDEHDLHRHA
jgi:hypothetical protein